MNTSVPETIGNFRILGKLGQGGMGTVYQAVHGTLERPVALKVLPPEFANNPEYVMRFLREARTIATLRHDNIVQVYDAGEQNGQYFIAMELVDGVNLLKFTEDKGEVPEAEGLNLLLQAAKGLAAAHAKSLVHRDIKPENLLLGKDGTLRIVDFGLVMESTSTTQLTATGACLGTPMYMSPEQADGESADSRTDLYSLGVTFYRVFTGRTPFTSPTVMNLLFKHKFEVAPEPKSVQPKLSQGCSNLLMHLLAKRREDRPQTAQKLIEMIELVQKGKSIPPPPKYVPPPSAATSGTMVAPSEMIKPAPDPAARRRLAIGAVAAVVLISVITAVVALKWKSDKTDQGPMTAAIQPVKPDQPGAEVIRKGDSAFDSGDFNSALNLYNVALKDAPNNEFVRNRIDRAKQALSYKECIEAAKKLEANGQLEEAALQYAAAVRYDTGSYAQLKLEVIRGKIAAAKQPPPAPAEMVKVSALDQEVSAAKEAEGSKVYDKAADHYSQAAQLSDGPQKIKYAEMAKECRRLDYIGRAKAAEIIKDYLSAEQFYKMAQQIKEDSAISERLDAIRIMNQANTPSTVQTNTPATSATPVNPSGFDTALADARRAIDKGDFKLARQKLESARQLQPARPEAVTMLKEVDGNEDLLKGDDARAKGDTETAIAWYTNARDVFPGLKDAATTRINALKNKVVPPAARDDKIEALVRAGKYTDALTEIGTQITNHPSNAQLKLVRDALDSMRTTLTFCDELGKTTESARQILSDAQDYEESAGKRKKDFQELHTRFGDYPGKQQSSFLARDYDGVIAISKTIRDDAAEVESKLSAAESFLDGRADKAKGVKFMGVGTGDENKAEALSRYARSLRKLLKSTHELLK